MTLLSYKIIVEGQGKNTVKNRIMKLSESFKKAYIYARPGERVKAICVKPIESVSSL